MPASEQGCFPNGVESKVVSYIEIGISPTQELAAGIGLLEAKLVRRGVNGMAPGVIGVDLKTVPEPVSGIDNSGVIACVDVRQREVEVAEAVVSGGTIRRA